MSTRVARRFGGSSSLRLCNLVQHRHRQERLHPQATVAQISRDEHEEELTTNEDLNIRN